MPNRHDTIRKLADLRKVLAGKTRILIVLQDNPDPDGMASAMALRRIANEDGLNCSIACDGTVGRAENRAMLRYVNLNLRSVKELDPASFEVVAMVDTQPGQRNNSLPEEVGPHVVIDHHPIQTRTRRASFTDVRSRYGATATILYEYLAAADIVPEAPLATALLYGIRSDTQDFGREATKADMSAFGELYPLANKRALGAIQRGQLPPEYFHMLAVALGSARLCGNAIYCELGTVDNPDMISEVADLLLRHEATEWSLCWGFVGEVARLSARSTNDELNAHDLVRKLTSRIGAGGGHRSMAGGQIPLKDSTAAERGRIDKLLRKRYVKATGGDPAACRRII